MKIAELVAKLGFQVDDNGAKDFEKRLQGLATGVAAVGASIAAVGAAVGAGLAKAFRDADEAATAAERLGLATNALIELRFAADRSDVSAESLGQSLSHLQREAVAAAQGNKEAAKGFARLGISVKDTNGEIKSTEQLFMETADAIAALPEGAEQTAAAFALMGKGSREMVPFLKKGGKAIEEERKRAAKFGLTLTKATQDSVEAFDQQLKDFRDAFRGILNQLLPALPGLTKLFGRFADFMVKVQPQVRRLGEEIGKLATWLSDRLGPAFEYLANKDLIGILVAALGTATIAFLALKGAAIGAAIAAGISLLPVAIILGVIFLLLEDLYAGLHGKENFLGKLTVWANSFDPNDSPVIKFLKNLLAYLGDLGNMDKLQVLFGLKRSSAEEEAVKRGANPEQTSTGDYRSLVTFVPVIGPAAAGLQGAQSAFNAAKNFVINISGTNKTTAELKTMVKEVMQEEGAEALGGVK